MAQIFTHSGEGFVLRGSDVTVDEETRQPRLCEEILGLTKLDWNTTAFSKQIPITLGFAQSVGKVLSEIPPEIPELRDHYRFYM